MTATAAARAAGVLLLALAAVHLGWASGVSWPARSREAVALAVVGSRGMPERAPTLLVALLLTVCGGLTAHRGCPRGFRLLLASAFASRAATPASVIELVLPPDPDSTFRRWNARIYRPLAAVIALLLARSAGVGLVRETRGGRGRRTGAGAAPLR